MLSFLLACTVDPGLPAADSNTALDSQEPVYCHGAEQVAETALSPTTDGLAERWDANSELLRILFIGSPT